MKELRNPKRGDISRLDPCYAVYWVLPKKEYASRVTEFRSTARRSPRVKLCYPDSAVFLVPASTLFIVGPMHACTV